MKSILELFTRAGSLLPVTLVGAIVLFLLKEFFESLRRIKSNMRKRKALRRLLADEIERNNWTIFRLRSCVTKISDSIDYPALSVSIRNGVDGNRYLRSEFKDGQLHGEEMIGEVQREVLSNNLLEIAMIDRKIFSQALEAVDALKELDHVLQCMVEEIADLSGLGALHSFPSFAKHQIADSEKILSNFYKSLTGQELKARRMR